MKVVCDICSLSFKTATKVELLLFINSWKVQTRCCHAFVLFLFSSVARLIEIWLSCWRCPHSGRRFFFHRPTIHYLEWAPQNSSLLFTSRQYGVQRACLRSSDGPEIIFLGHANGCESTFESKSSRRRCLIYSLSSALGEGSLVWSL